jgi:hypothetical protein
MLRPGIHDNGGSNGEGISSAAAKRSAEQMERNGAFSRRSFAWTRSGTQTSVASRAAGTARPGTTGARTLGGSTPATRRSPFQGPVTTEQPEAWVPPNPEGKVRCDILDGVGALFTDGGVALKAAAILDPHSSVLRTMVVSNGAVRTVHALRHGGAGSVVRFRD